MVIMLNKFSTTPAELDDSVNTIPKDITSAVVLRCYNPAQSFVL